MTWWHVLLSICAPLLVVVVAWAGVCLWLARAAQFEPIDDRESE